MPFLIYRDKMRAVRVAHDTHSGSFTMVLTPLMNAYLHSLLVAELCLPRRDRRILECGCESTNIYIALWDIRAIVLG